MKTLCTSEDPAVRSRPGPKDDPNKFYSTDRFNLDYSAPGVIKVKSSLIDNGGVKVVALTPPWVLPLSGQTPAEGSGTT